MPLRDGSTRERRNYVDVLIRARSFYLDLQEWALHGPSWALWVVPSPIRKGDAAGLIKTRRKVIAEMRQRVRERLPKLPATTSKESCPPDPAPES